MNKKSKKDIIRNKEYDDLAFGYGTIFDLLVQRTPQFISGLSFCIWAY